MIEKCLARQNQKVDRGFKKPDRSNTTSTVEMHFPGQYDRQSPS